MAKSLAGNDNISLCLSVITSNKIIFINFNNLKNSMPKNAKRFYITTAIDYVNAKPHIGHAYEKILADVIARYNRLAGKNVYFLTGTDDNASKNDEAAKKAGIPTRKFVDQNAEEFRKLCDLLSVSYDYFIRTVDKEHVRKCQAIFQKAYNQGDIYKGFYEGLYCKGCEAFYTERDLVDGKCSEHLQAPEFLREESYFFKLSKYKNRILKLLRGGFIVPKEKTQEIIARLENDSLLDISVSRVNKEWGIKVPFDPNHTIYVWFDALLNYYTGAKDHWPADIHVIGKGINWFHTVIWPAMLMSLKLPLPKFVAVHGYLTMNGQKIGKSLGNVIDPIILIEKYGLDPVRYFIIREIPFGSDGDFNETELIKRYNNELANDLGNLISRLSTLLEKKCDGTIPASKSKKLFEEKKLKEISSFVDSLELHRALEELFSLLKLINKHLNDTEPWKIKDQKKIDSSLYTCIDALRMILIPLRAFIPSTVEKINHQFQFSEASFKQFKWNLLKPGQKVVVVPPLFPKIVVETKSVFLLNLKVGSIQKVSPHPNADKLYVLEVNIGKTITLVAGIKNYYTQEQLLHHKVIVVCNLQHAKLRGVESQGMLLAAEDANEVRLLTADAKEGTEVKVEGYDINTAQISYDQFDSITLRIDGGTVFYDQTPLLAGNSSVKVDMPSHAKIR